MDGSARLSATGAALNLVPTRALLTTTRLSPRAFVTLLVLACMFGGNHDAARIAEPVAALGRGWLILDQAVAPVQVLGALLVVGTAMALGLRRR